MSAAIETRRLTREYGGRKVVDGLDLSVPAGTAFAFLGPNGAGKSTTFRMLCGLLAPTSGSASVLGFDTVKDRAELQRSIGFMPQHFNLYGHLTVEENIAFYGDLYLDSRKEARARRDELIAHLELAQFRTTRAAELSGGWRQRLSLACAVLHKPRVLFLDEPTVGLDPMARRVFWGLLQELHASGVTLFVTTHYMEEVERCGLLGLIVAGKLRVAGGPGPLKEAVGRASDLFLVRARDPQAALHALLADHALFDAYLYGDVVHVTYPVRSEGLLRAQRALRGLSAEVLPRAPIMEDVFVRSTAPPGAKAWRPERLPEEGAA